MFAYRVSKAAEGGEYAKRRYEFEARRRYEVMDGRLADKTYFLWEEYSIVGMAAWGRVERHEGVLGAVSAASLRSTRRRCARCSHPTSAEKPGSPLRPDRQGTEFAKCRKRPDQSGPKTNVSEKRQ